MNYNKFMKTIVSTNIFDQWFASLRDKRAKALIEARLRRVELGNLGDCEPVGEGVSELRIHWGAGYRVYFIQRGLELVVLLAGGDKSTQTRDIKTAIEVAKQLKEQ